MQADLDKGRWDNGMLNDVIDSIGKSSNDDRLPQRDRDVLADDLEASQGVSGPTQSPALGAYRP
jgi:hypothetical protein